MKYILDIKTYGAAVHAMKWEQVSPEDKRRIKSRISKIAKMPKSGKSPHVGIKTRLYFHFARLLHKCSWDSSPTEKAYWENFGWPEKSRPWKNNKGKISHL